VCFGARYNRLVGTRSDPPPFFSVLGADFIPVYGQLVADLIRKRLTQPEEEVEA
jgi:hypothetical protein